MDNHLYINQEKICQVLHENTGNRKSCGKLLAHSVKDEPKEQRVKAWDNFTETCQNSGRCLGCIITGDEWVPDISVVMKQKSDNGVADEISEPPQIMLIKFEAWKYVDPFLINRVCSTQYLSQRENQWAVNSAYRCQNGYQSWCQEKSSCFCTMLMLILSW